MLGFVDLLEWERAAAEVRAALEKSAKKIARKPGASCERCREYNSWAEVDETGVFRCWQCRNDPFR